jgi:MerR family transcriptional regulator/heat shock protein HspR
MHQQTLRYYERAGLVEPKRTGGNIRMYSNSDIERIRLIQRWIDDFGVNLAGAEIMMRMSAQIRALQDELAATQGGVGQVAVNSAPRALPGWSRLKLSGCTRHPFAASARFRFKTRPQEN